MTKRRYTTILEALDAKIIEIDGGYGSRCWMWTGKPNADGYGTITWEGVKYLVHRLMVLLRDGELAERDAATGEWIVVDHLCHNRWCCHPDHLEPVTNRINTLRGESKTAVAHVLGICQRGHDLRDPANLYYRKDKAGYGYCKACVLDRNRARKGTQKQAAEAA